MTRRLRAVRPAPSLLSLSLDAFKLSMEAQAVVGLRLFQAATGAGSARENTRMISEKIATVGLAQQAAAVAFATGHADIAAERMMRVYHRIVKANRKRLSG